MKDIGSKLSAKRKEMKLSVDDVAKMTKMPVSHILAIEAGDIEYFEDDITYLRFYVRAYCKILNIPFDEIKDYFDDSVDTYTQNLSLKAIKEREELEESIQVRSKVEVPKSKNYKEPPIATIKDRGSIRQNAKQSSKFKKRGKLDVSLWSLLIIIAIIVAVVIFVFLNNGFGGVKDTKEPEVGDVVDNNTPSPEKEDTDKEPQKEEEKEEPLSVHKINPTTYEVVGVKVNDKITFEVTFENGKTSYEVVGVKVNDKITFEVTFENGKTSWIGMDTIEGQYGLANAVYTEQNPLKLESIAQVTNNYYIRFGAYSMEGMKVLINGQQVVFDESLSVYDQKPLNILITVKEQ